VKNEVLLYVVAALAGVALGAFGASAVAQLRLRNLQAKERSLDMALRAETIA